MSTVNIPLSDALAAFVHKQVHERGDASGSGYLCELIREDQRRQQLRGLLLDGADSVSTTPVGRAYFESLRGAVLSSATPHCASGHTSKL